MHASVNRIKRKKEKGLQPKSSLGLDLGCAPPQLDPDASLPGFLDPPPGDLDTATSGGSNHHRHGSGH
jgi:hypothetical protein